VEKGFATYLVHMVAMASLGHTGKKVHLSHFLLCK
jgi:hypothetical protein